jgi:ADP-ribosylglycohydrolase
MRVVASSRVGARTLVRRAALLATTVALARASPPALPPRFPPVPVAARVRAALLGGLAGDALALAGHYEYDAAVIAKKHGGSVTDYAAPGSNHGVGWGTANYHPGKLAGDMTDAGDVALMALEHVAALAQKGERYSFDAFEAHWRSEILERGYGACNFQSVGREHKGPCPAGLRPGYLNGGTRRTLEAVATAAARSGGVAPSGPARMALAADVNCLVSATHFLPLFLLDTDENALAEAAASTVFLSHKNRDPVAAAGFLARALHRLLHGREPLRQALQGAADAGGDAFISKCLADAVAKVEEVNAPGSALAALGTPHADDAACTSMARLWDVGRSEPIKVGKASPTEGALPSALYFSLRYADSLEKALIANANVGGDSAARGIVIGMLLGAVHADEAAAMPERWLAGLNARPRVEQLLSDVAAAAQAHGGPSDKSEL